MRYLYVTFYLAWLFIAVGGAVAFGRLHWAIGAVWALVSVIAGYLVMWTDTEPVEGRF